MKLKQATKLAIIGVILQIIILFFYILANYGVIKINRDIGILSTYGFTQVINAIGIALLLPFFINLLKSQK